jgi:hypothetical protein
LILGVEKLLTEADKKGLTEENEEDPNFNPINFLAQYLLRNNPKYSNFSVASPYVRGLREVADELRRQLFHNTHTVKPAHAVTSINQSPISKSHLFLVLS